MLHPTSVHIELVEILLIGPQLVVCEVSHLSAGAVALTTDVILSFLIRFTFHQMIPEKISWAIHLMNAQAVMALASISQVSQLDLANAMPDNLAD